MRLPYLILKICFVELILLNYQDASGQYLWVQRINQELYDRPTNLLQGDSASFYFTYRSSTGSPTPVLQHLTKWDASGTELWDLTFDNLPNNLYEGPIGLLSNNDVIVCFLGIDPLNYEYIISRISPEGNCKWTSTLPALISLEIEYSMQIYEIIPHSENDIRLYFWMNYHNELDPPSAKNGVISLDSNGIEQFRTYFNTNGEYHRPYSIIQYKNNQYIKVYRPTLGAVDLILRYEYIDSSYNPVWSFEMGPESLAGGGPVCSDIEGNIYFTWNYDTTGGGGPFNQLSSIVSLNPNGEFRWIKHFGEDRGIPVFYDILSTKDNRIIACGQDGNHILSGGRERTGWIICIDTIGTKLWERRYIINEASESGNNFNYLIEDINGGIILSGTLYPEPGSDVYLMKTDDHGCFTENCELYNFISLITDIDNIDSADYKFYYYVSNNTLHLGTHDLILFENLKFDMFNTSGILVANGPINSNITEIDISSILPGIYYIRIYREFREENLNLIKLFISK